MTLTLASGPMAMVLGSNVQALALALKAALTILGNFFVFRHLVTICFSAPLYKYPYYLS